MVLAQRPRAGRPTEHSDMIDEISAVWRSVLDIDELDPDATFFSVGGISLALLRVHHVIQERFNRPIAMVDLFRHTTVRSLAQALAAGEGGPPVVIATPGQRPAAGRVRDARAQARERARRATDGER